LSSISNILITGGTGSFGKSFLKKIVKLKEIKRIVIFSRDELKQWELQQKYPPSEFPQIRFFLGDIRDFKRLSRALENIDTVVHAAALKQVPAAEYNPMEFVKTNVIGSENIIQACFDNNVKNVVALSTDKATAPINLYGATKLCSDKLFTAANNIKGQRDIKFSVVRYGNVMGSRGSVIPYFLEKIKKRTSFLPITSEKMTRFNITLEEGVEMVLWALRNAFGGEIFIPKIPSFRVIDLAEAIGPSCNKEIVGIRFGEKIDEDLITSSESISTIDIGNYYVILPEQNDLFDRYKNTFKSFKKVEEGFSYNSRTNKNFLSISEIRNLIREHIDEKFKPF
tara:strand:- start:1899 stop:2915 length:1017 start_codon:yes stop_codon:yes gene_type:complete